MTKANWRFGGSRRFILWLWNRWFCVSWKIVILFTWKLYLKF